MSTTFENIKGDAGKAMELFTLPGKIAENAVRTLEGKPFFASTRHDIVDTGWNLLAAPPRVLWHIIKGTAAGTLRLTWNLIKLLPLPLPMLDSWKKERGDVAMRTKDALEALKLFRFDVDSKFELPRSLPTAQQQQDTAPRALAA